MIVIDEIFNHASDGRIVLELVDEYVRRLIDGEIETGGYLTIVRILKSTDFQRVF